MNTPCVKWRRELTQSVTFAQSSPTSEMQNRTSWKPGPVLSLADPDWGRGGAGPGLSWPPDLEAPVYNLRAKQWILEPLCYILLKKNSHSSSLTLLIISMFHILVCILLHYMDSTHNLSYL